jgi:hypothetical protein
MNNVGVATNANRNDEMCVYSTTDYGQFKAILGNRKVNMGNVSKIMQSMKKEHLKVPAIVNGKMEVCDGQHRLEACKELEVPFYFIIIPNYDLNEVQEINANQKNWTNDDFLKSFVVRHEADRSLFINYVTMDYLMEVHKVGLTPMITMVYGGCTNRSVQENFRDGNLPEVDEKEVSYMIEEFVALSETFPKKGWTKHFMSAYLAMRDQEVFEFTRLIDMLKKHQTLVNDIEDTSSSKKIHGILCAIYNNEGDIQRKKAIFAEEVGYAIKDTNAIQWA